MHCKTPKHIVTHCCLYQTQVLTQIHFKHGTTLQQGSYRKIHSKVTNISQTFSQNMAWCSMARKSNTKVRFSAHPVKGCYPYGSRWPTHSISQNCDSKCILCGFTKQIFLFLFFKTTVQSWEMQFLTDKLTVFPWHSEDHKFTHIHRPHSVFTDFQGLNKAYPIFPKLSKTMQTL